MNEVMRDLKGMEDGAIVFASPIPALIKKATLEFGGWVKIFHNDHREKKELPNGRIIMVVAQEGWELV
jgi:hypothetical protein